jgi:putative transposase
MTTYRKVVFANNQIYHVYNRGVERRPIFLNKREFDRAVITISFYRFAGLPLRLSKFLILPTLQQQELIDKLKKSGEKRVEIIAFCLIPNHFHFLLKQTKDNGISSFLSDFTNSYSKYFNGKYKRVGPLFQGLFKAKRVETDEQLIHLSRYIHLNPVTSYLVKEKKLREYTWSSYREYLGLNFETICNTQEVLDQFPSREKYERFVYDQMAYARELEKIKHLLIE